MVFRIHNIYWYASQQSILTVCDAVWKYGFAKSDYIENSRFSYSSLLFIDCGLDIHVLVRKILLLSKKVKNFFMIFQPEETGVSKERKFDFCVCKCHHTHPPLTLLIRDNFKKGLRKQKKNWINFSPEKFSSPNCRTDWWGQ